jgi:cell division septal protein FtsQ
MRKNKTNTSRHKMKAASFFTGLIEVLIIFVLIGLILFAAFKIMKNMDYFKVTSILINGNKAADLGYLKDKNIFSLNLEKESEYIASTYPDYKEIRLIRVLPNRLFVDFVRRTPVAYVKLYRNFCTDSAGVLFEVPQDLAVNQLPVILGLETKIFGAKAGRKYNIKELNVALEILGQINKNRLLKSYQVKNVDVSNLTNISFFMSALPGVLILPDQINFTPLQIFEVKIGRNNIDDQIAFLGTMLTQERSRLKDLKYIDLRFKEAVVKYK